MSTLEAKRYDQGLWFLEKLRLNQLRKQLLAEVCGDVLEIGAGTGANVPFYSGTTTVTAVDIIPNRLAGAKKKIETYANNGRIHLAVANAEDLPFMCNNFDHVISTLVFCSIPDPLRALIEIKRVLRPNGQLWMLEHVRGLTPVTQRLTDWLHPTWFALQGECHLNRETAVTVQQAGFEIENSTVYGRGFLQMIQAKLPSTG